MVDETIVTALIGAGGTAVGAILGATIPAVLNASREKKRLGQVNDSRRTAIVGFWRGEGSDCYVEGDGNFLEFELQAQFREESKQIIGEAILSSTTDRNVALVLSGGFYDDYFLQFTYKSKDPIRKQLGVIVLRLSDLGDRLDGHYAGLSPIRGKFIMGRVTLRSDLRKRK